jgi:alkylation response protein AidB-like acyl-CoA dehydrogenase
MDLRYSKGEEEFRRELRAWLDQAVRAHGIPPAAEDWPGRRQYDTSWQGKLYEAGYGGINWPKEYGGRDGSPTEQLIFYEECARANAPRPNTTFVGLLHGGPTLIAEGTPEQKKRHLAPILRGEQVWCQGFSEPGAGSDLAALRTRAVRDGDDYVVSGHKIWTSFAQVADYCELLVRTDPGAPRHHGISWLIMPMDSKGIEIRPLLTMMGESEFSEVFYTDVRVPVTSRVGAENDGWRVANVTLRFERGTSFAHDMVRLQQFVSEMVDLAKRVTHNDANAWEDRGLRREIGHLAAEVDALWAMLKLSVREASETGVPSVGASAIKLFYSELNQRASEVAMRLLGRAGLSREDVGSMPSDKIVSRRFGALALKIAGGSSQVQRNIIGERILGLPKEPR